MKNPMLFLNPRQLAVLLGAVVAFMISWTVLRKDPSAATDSPRDLHQSMKRTESREPSPANPGLHSGDAPRASASQKPVADIAPDTRGMPQDAGLIVTSVPVGGDLIKSVVKINDAGRQVRQRMIHANFKYPMLAVEEPINGEPADNNNPYPNGHVADHLLVTIKAGVNKAQVQAMADELGLTVRHQIEGSPCFLLSFPVRDFSSLDQARDLLKKRNEVELVDLDSMVHAAAIPNDPRYGELYNMSKIQAPSAWNITTGSRAVTVAVLDSGIDYNHPDLAANIWSDPGETGLDDQGRDKRTNGEDDDGNGKKDDWRGWNIISGNNDPMDSYKHGSHCAGTIGAVGNNGIGVAGVCWQVSLVPVKIIDDSGNGSSSTVVAGLYYAADNGFDIASMSVGGPYSGSIQAALEYARTKGLLCVASAGNDNVNTDVSPQSPGSHILDNLISVMNTGTSDEKSASSNYGLTTVSLAAPGINILSTVPNNGYELKTGTSMSAPLVAGACALLKSYNPSLTPTEVKQAIMAGVDVIPGLSGLCVSGGRLNVYKSLTIVTGPFPSYISSAFTEAVSGDGNINPGEDAVGTITLSNYTMGPITGMVGQLSTSDPDVTVINGTLNYGTLNAGQTTSGSGQYRVRLSAGSTPRFVALSLTVTSDTGGTWTFPVGYSCVNSASIFGYVRSHTGSAIAGATVSWSGTGSGQVATGADGFYVIPAVDGSYSVTASAFGFISSSPVPLTVPPYLRQDFTLDSVDLTITPNPLSIQVAGGQTASSPLTLTNTGSLPVTWSIPTTGYRFMTSDQPGGPAYVWNDIVATGTRVTGLGDDTNLGPFPLGFSMPFYGTNFTEIHMGSNGFLSFTSTANGLTLGTLPNASLPENLIAPLMRDQDLRTAGTVHYQQIDGDTFVVQYTDVPRYGAANSSKKVTFQVVLKRDGTIIFYYQRTDDPAVGLVGVQNAARNAGLMLAYNQAFLKPGLAVRIQEAKPAWLGFTPTSGTIAVGSSTTVTVSGNAAGLATGNYEANIIVDSNDTGTPVQAARVSFAVGAVPPTITAWPTASSLVYGQALSASTLSGGSASVAGTFTFDSPATVLNAGTQSVPVTFTPTDTATASPVSGSVNVVVAKATPVITAWPTASAINFGQYFNAPTLTGGSASVAGTFAFNDPTLFAGSDTFTFKVNDGTVDSSPATVSIAVGSSLSPTGSSDPLAESFQPNIETVADRITDLYVTCDNSYEVYVNGTLIGTGSNWQSAGRYQNTLLQVGRNVVAIKGIDAGGVAALLVEMVVNGQRIGSGSSWKRSLTAPADWNTPSFDDSSWVAATEYGAYGITPWNKNAAGMPADTPAKWMWSSNNDLDNTVYFRYVIDVISPNTPPTANAQSVTFQPGTPKAITLTGSDPDGDPLSYVILTQPTYGTLSGTLPNVTYTPPALPIAGSHDVTVTFTPTDTANFHSVTGTVSVTVNPATTPYAQWTTQYPGHDLSDPNGDSDGDGQNNFHEFAFGLNPTNGNSTNPIVTPLDKASHSFSYTRRANSRLTYTVCISINLNGWQDLLPTQVTENVSVNAATGVETVGVTILPTSLPDTNNLFLRVKAN